MLHSSPISVKILLFMGPVKFFFQQCKFPLGNLDKYEVFWLAFDCHLDRLMVNVFEDLVVICWLILSVLR